jgi:hypothetical protein
LDKSRRAGFELLEKTHLGFAIFPPVFYGEAAGSRPRTLLPRAVGAPRGKTDSRVASEPLVRWLLEIEYPAGRPLRYPTGIRCVLLLRKSAAP